MPDRITRVLCLALVACGGHHAAGPEVAIVGESTRLRLGDPLPATTPWFDGARVTLSGARGEILGIQVAEANPAPTALTIAGATVRSFAVTALAVVRPSTAMYGGSHGAGRYADAIAPAVSPATNPAYFEIVADAPGVHAGTLAIGTRTFPVTLTIADVALPPLARSVWAYEDPRELAWAASDEARGTPDHPAAMSPDERACIATFRDYGIQLSPDLALDSWLDRRATFDGFTYVPVDVGDDPATIGANVRAWIDATRGSGHIPFAIPIDEPHDHEARVKVRALADLVRAAGGGPTTFVFAVTDTVRDEYGDAIDLYLQAKAVHLTGDRYQRWTYNGGPPGSGALLLDGETPGTRTWGWIMWRYRFPVWYVWDALYWHDRHNRKKKKLALPGPIVDAATDAVSFDDGEDHGNLDGVLALPGCKPTLRMAALRRGLQDRALLELASACAPEATAKLAAEVVPRAVGDATAGIAWSTDEADWERARQKLLVLASCKRQGLQ